MNTEKGKKGRKMQNKQRYDNSEDPISVFHEKVFDQV